MYPSAHMPAAKQARWSILCTSCPWSMSAMYIRWSSVVVLMSWASASIIAFANRILEYSMSGLFPLWTQHFRRYS